MKELFKLFGRGYLVAFMLLICSTVLAAIVLFATPDKMVWVMEWWQGMAYLAAAIVGGKVVEKIGTAFGKIDKKT